MLYDTSSYDFQTKVLSGKWGGGRFWLLAKQNMESTEKQTKSVKLVIIFTFIRLIPQGRRLLTT